MPRNTSGLIRGGPGRKPGVPNKASVEAKEACSRLVDDPRYLARLEARLIAGKLAPAVEAMLWHYAKGKPKDRVELTGADGGPLEVKEARESIAGRLAGLAARLHEGRVAGEPQ